MPPSTGSTCPVMYDAASEARKTNAPATSSAWAHRFNGIRFIMLAANFSLVRMVSVIGVAASGASALTIIRVQVLGNVLGPIFVFSTGLISVCMILASGLSFLGLGVRPPEPEWGLMLNTLRTAIYTQPWVAALPGLMIFITSISFNILADRLRAAMAIKE